MQCPKCNAENEDGTTVCNSCGESIEIAYPRAVFLNQISRGPYSSPTNVAAETMAIQILSKNRKRLIIGVIGFFLLGFIFAYVVANHLQIRDFIRKILIG